MFHSCAYKCDTQMAFLEESTQISSDVHMDVAIGLRVFFTKTIYINQSSKLTTRTLTNESITSRSL
jgi:hypothetical protein